VCSLGRLARLVSLALAWFWLAALPQSAAALTLYTEEYPPVSFSQKGRAEGMSTEVVRELLRRLGQNASIEVVPWARGMRIVQSTPDTALFTTIRNAEREQKFRWVGPILIATDAFYALKGSGIVVNSRADLARFKEIAVPRDWFTYEELTAAGMRNLLGLNEPAQMFRMLKLGRVELIVADNLSFHAKDDAAAQVAGLKAGDVEVVYPYRTSYGYIAFWRDTPAEVVTRWQAALDGMKRDGSFGRIYRRWLPGEPEPPLRAPQQQ
jgi:polar amino acid transport system substrate-binding protein